MILQKPAKPLKCQRCLHEWPYTGKNEYFATCPHCRTYVNVKKNVIPQTDSRLGPSVQSVVYFTKGDGFSDG